MVTVGFVVEGDSEKRLIKSELFQQWLREDCNLEVVDQVVNAAGSGNMCSRNIGVLVENLRTEAKPDKVVVLADLDPEKCAPCVQARKEIIGPQDQDIDLIAIAKKAMESWFLADTEAMRRWLGDNTFCEDTPETLAGMPWDRLKELGSKSKRGQGPGTKSSFSRKFILRHKFDVRRAARHAQCPSARYFVERLCALGNLP